MSDQQCAERMFRSLFYYEKIKIGIFRKKSFEKSAELKKSRLKKWYFAGKCDKLKRGKNT